MSQKQEDEKPVELTGIEKQDMQEEENIFPERAEEAKWKTSIQA